MYWDYKDELNRPLDPGFEYYLECDFDHLIEKRKSLGRQWKESDITARQAIKISIIDIQDRIKGILVTLLKEGYTLSTKMKQFKKYTFSEDLKDDIIFYPKKDLKDTKQPQGYSDGNSTPIVNQIFPPDTNYQSITLSFEDGNSIKIVGPNYNKTHFTRDLGFTKRKDIKEFNAQGRLLFAFAATRGTLTYKELFTECETSDIGVIQKAVSMLRISLKNLFGITRNPIKYSKSQYKMLFNIKDWLAKPHREYKLIDSNKNIENYSDSSDVIENDSTDDFKEPEELNFDH